MPTTASPSSSTSPAFLPVPSAQATHAIDMAQRDQVADGAEQSLSRAVRIDHYKPP